MNLNKKFIFFLSMYFFCVPKFAFAYLDPGAGSYVLQIVLAIVIGGLYSLKRYFHKIKRFLVKFISKDENQS
jgi:hypothetical protein